MRHPFLRTLAGATAAPSNLYVEDVFSTWLYNGTGATNIITNGIDLSGQGGLVWTKTRSTATGHRFVDTARGATISIDSSANTANLTESAGITSFNNSGYVLSSSADYNSSSRIFTSWTFRKAAKFFDVVTYTGNGTNRTIAHNLGSVPGCIMVKRTDTTADWQVYHRGLANDQYIVLNSAAGASTGATRWNSTTPTSTEFSLGTDLTVNANGGTYVAYLFAHNAGGFGDSGTDNIISCGTYTGNGSTTGPTIDLGWEPQFVLIKRASTSAADWLIFDQARGIASGGSDPAVFPNLTNAEVSTTNYISVLPTGFQVTTNLSSLNGSGATQIYIAIRRGPMKTPTDATTVFQPTLYTGTNVSNRLVTTDILTDMAWVRQRNDSGLSGMVVGDRLRGQAYLLTGTTAAEVTTSTALDQQIVSSTEYGTAWSSMTGFWVGNDATSKLNQNTTSNNHVALAFRRAPGFFDIVTYTGSGISRAISHNLKVAPELIIIKNRSEATTPRAWAVYAGDSTKYLVLNTTAAAVTDSLYWNNTAPTSSNFTVGTSQSTNENADNHVAYLFASLTGVSKVGTYTGNGTSQTINCGFTAGARFVLIKRTDSTGDWLIADTARGLVSGNDPFLRLNSTAAEVTTVDWIDPDNSGFVVVQEATANANVNNATYTYLAIA